MRVSDTIKKSVVFFGLRSERDRNAIDYRGTGFFVGVPLTGKEADRRAGFLYLVTARHVAEKLAGREFVVRTNTRDGKSVLISNAADVSVPWFFHPNDPNADVVLTPWITPPEADVDFKAVPRQDFVKNEYLTHDGIGIGSEIYIVGLFRFHGGQSKNHPMLRMGSIAMIPDEKVSTKSGEMDAYLIEARSIGGISGSPVFVSAPWVSKQLLLLGLIHGHWDLKASQKNDVVTDAEDDEESRINMGIAIVTPVQKILDILNCEELSTARESVERTGQRK